MKKLRFSYYFVCMMFLLAAPAFAYVDPNTTTILISGIAAIAIAAGAVINSVARKAKKKAMEALNIDENAGKKTEDDLVVFAEEEPAAESAAEEAAAPEAEPAPAEDEAE